MAYTPMKTWTSETLTSSDMTTYLTDNIEYLYGQVSGLTASACDIRRAATQSIADTTATNIGFDTESLDIGGWWSSGSVITVPSGAVPSGSTAVLVMVRGRISYSSNGTGNRRIRVLKNGSSFASMTVDAVVGGDTDYFIVDFETVTSGDELTLEAYQTSGGNLNVTEANLAVVRLFPTS